MTNSLSSNIQQNVCLATVSSKEYWPGTITMIKSFLRHNKWFEGDIIIISNDKYVHQKTKKNDRLKCLYPNPVLLEKTTLLASELPKYKSLRNRFYIFEIFKLLNYNYVIYADSDLLFRSSLQIDDLFNNELSAVADPWHFRNFRREKNTFDKIPQSDSPQKNCFKSFFNSGFLVVGKSKRNHEKFSELISYIRPVFMSEVKDVLADEPILNTSFENNVSILPVTYNCSIHLIMEGIVKINPYIIHFTGKHKPWKIKSWLILPYRNIYYTRYLLEWMRSSVRPIV